MFKFNHLHRLPAPETHFNWLSSSLTQSHPGTILGQCVNRVGQGYLYRRNSVASFCNSLRIGSDPRPSHCESNLQHRPSCHFRNAPKTPRNHDPDRQELPGVDWSASRFGHTGGDRPNASPRGKNPGTSHGSFEIGIAMMLIGVAPQTGDDRTRRLIARAAGADQFSECCPHRFQIANPRFDIC